MIVLAATALGLRIAIAVCAAAAVGALIVAASVLLSKREARIERRLAGYEMHPTLVAGRPDLFDLSTDSEVVAKAVVFTRDLAVRAGVLAMYA